jgi:hypothetical protein
MTLLDSPSNRDRFLYPIDIVADVNDTIWFVVGASSYEITIPAGRYYNWREPIPPSWLSDDYPSIFLQIETLLGTATSESWVFRAATPTKSHRQFGAGLALTRVAGASNTWGWQFNNGAFNFDKRVLGYAADEDTQKSTSGAELIAPFTRWMDLLIPKRWKSKHPNLLEEQFASNGSYDTQVRTRWKAHKLRAWVYSWVSEALIFSGKANDAAYAAAADLAVGDCNNALEDLYKEALRTGAEIIVVHDAGDQDLGVSEHGHEVVKTRGEVGELNGFINPQGARGGRWGIEMALWVNPDTEKMGYEF